MRNAYLAIGSVVIGACLSATTARSAILALYDNDDLSASATEADPDLVASALTATAITLGAGLAGPVSWPDALSSYAHTLTGSLAASIAAEDFFQFAVSTVGDVHLYLQSLAIRMSINTGNISVDNTIQFYLFSNLAGAYTAGNELGSFSLTRSAGATAVVSTNHTYDLTGVTVLNDLFHETAEFRIYAVQTTGQGNRMGIGLPFGDDGQPDLQLNGAVIPEPGTFNMFVIALAVVFAARSLRPPSTSKRTSSSA